MIHGQGMPSQRHHEPGDMFVKISVKFPDYVDPALVSHLEAALPKRNPIPKFPKSVLVEDVNMTDLDARQREAVDRDPDAMDEDEAHPRVQCANQ